MRLKLTLLVLLTSNQLLQAQGGFEYRQKLGFLLAHRSLMAHLPQAPAVASELSYIYQTKQQKKWHQAYRQPLVGGTLFFGSVGNNQILGKYTGLYGFVELPIIKYKRYRLDFRFATGLGYTNRPFDPILNPENVAIGSKVNALMCFALKQSYRIGAYGLTFGIDMTHFSNASYQMPNLGINVPFLSLGVQRFFDNITANEQLKELNRPNYNFGASLIYSQKEMRPVGVGRYPVYAGNIFARKYFGPKAGLEMSLDVIYKTGLLHHPSYPQATGLDPLQIGIYVGYIQPFDRIQYIYGLGYYVRDVLKPDDPFYIRLGTRYSFTPNIEGQFSLKTHYAKADYMELGLIYHFNR
ncbi:MAG: acyloxyacyl hydrolase [Flavobacteriales bacterium]